jgi:hypothetical protein
MKLDTSDPNEEFSRRELGRLSSLLHSREHRDVEKHQNSAKRIMQSAQQKGIITNDAANIRYETVPMERVSYLW